MLRYVIIIFQTIWTLLHNAYALVILMGKCIFYLISSFLIAILVTVSTVVSYLNAFYEEVALFFNDINNRTTAVLDCIAEETTNNINNISKFATGVLAQLSRFTNCGNRQLQTISDAIALATGWIARTLNGALFFIGDVMWSTVRFIPHLLLMPLVFIYKLVANALTLILLSLVRLLRMPFQSLFAIVLIITIFRFRRCIYILSRAAVIRIFNYMHQIFRNRRNFRTPGDASTPILESLRNSRLPPGTYEVPALRNRRNFSSRIYTTTTGVLSQIYQIFVNRRNRPVEIIHNEGSLPETSFCSRPKTPINTNSFDNSCVICQEQLKCVVLLPCKHLCLCERCAQRITLYQDTCPLCRICVKTKMTVYI